MMIAYQMPNEHFKTVAWKQMRTKTVQLLTCHDLRKMKLVHVYRKNKTLADCRVFLKVEGQWELLDEIKGSAKEPFPFPDWHQIFFYIGGLRCPSESRLQ